MKKLKLMTLVMCLSVVFSCGTKTGTGSLIGLGAGAGLGALVGHFAGNAAVGAAVGGAVGAGTGALIGKHMDKVAKQAAAVENAKVETVTDANGLSCVKVTFDSGILFQTGKYDLNAASRAQLSDFANVLRSNPDCYVDIQGHTDSTGSDAVNNPLSRNRANSVLNYLSSCGVPYSQFKNVTGYGSTMPVASNDTAYGRQQNRRVEIYLYASEAMIQAANNGTLQ